MKMLKVLSCMVVAGVLVAGCKGGEKKAEKAEEAAVPQAAAALPSEGSYKIADIFAKKDELNGKAVTVSGNVVKVNLGIMGKNWIHLQDGTGSADTKTNDITVTTDGTAQKDDKVSVTGVVVTNKDFGSGYKYDVIIESATVNAK